jgi:hypothetical protein
MRQDSSNKGQAQVRTRSVSILPDGRRFVVEDEVTKKLMLMEMKSNQHRWNVLR